MTAQPAPIPVPFADDPLLRVALAAHLGRYRGASRVHTESDLHVYLRWCAECNVQPLAARRADVELYVRWLQEVRRFKLSTGPSVPPESPTLGLSHLQFEAIVTAARNSTNIDDFALVAMLGLLGLRIFEPCATSIDDLGEEHGHRVLRVCGKGTRSFWSATTGGRPCHRSRHRRVHRRADPVQSAGPADGPTRRYPPAQTPREGRQDENAADAPTHAAAHLRHDPAWGQVLKVLAELYGDRISDN